MSRAALEQVLRQFPEPLLVKNRRGVWMFVNPAMCRLMRRPAEALLGRTDAELFSAERAAAYRAVHDRVIDGGVQADETEVFQIEDGDERILRTRKRLVAMPGATSRCCWSGSPTLLTRIASSARYRKARRTIAARWN